MGKITGKQIKAVVECYEQGQTIRQIGSRLVVSPTTVANLLRKQGIPLRKVGTYQRIPKTIGHNPTKVQNDLTKG